MAKSPELIAFWTLAVIFPFHEKEIASIAEKLLRKDVRKAKAKNQGLIAFWTLAVIFPFHEKEIASVAEKVLRKDVRKANTKSQGTHSFLNPQLVTRNNLT